MRVCIDTFVDAVAEVTAKSGRVYKFEFSWMFGPSLLREDGELRKNQTHLENPRHEFWPAFNDWLAVQKRPLL